jgi:hypothetical protein
LSKVYFPLQSPQVHRLFKRAAEKFCGENLEKGPPRYGEKVRLLLFVDTPMFFFRAGLCPGAARLKHTDGNNEIVTEQQGQVYFLCMLSPAGRAQVRKYAIEENYRAPSRMGIENSGEA